MKENYPNSQSRSIACPSTAAHTYTTTGKRATGMEITSLPDVEGEVTSSDTQRSTIVKKPGIVGEVDDRVITVSVVTFRPTERTKMHKHDYGQVLYVLEGPGMVGSPTGDHVVDAGDLIFFEPGEEHWHGAMEDATGDFSHLTYVIRDEVGTGTTVTED